MIRDDYVLRMVAQLAAVIARMLGLRKGGQLAAALREAEQAHEILGLPAGLFDKIDARALATILKTPEKMKIVADLLDEEAATMELMDDPRATHRRALAYALRMIAR